MELRCLERIKLVRTSDSFERSGVLILLVAAVSMVGHIRTYLFIAVSGYYQEISVKCGLK